MPLPAASDPSRPLLAKALVVLGILASFLAALVAISTFAQYMNAAGTRDVPFIVLAISLLPALVLIGTVFTTYWVYMMREDAIWLSAAMATSPAWPFAVANLDPSRTFVEHAKLSDVGATWAWTIGFLFVAGYMNRLKSKGLLHK